MDPSPLLEALLRELRGSLRLRAQWLEAHASMLTSGLEALERLLAHLRLLTRDPSIELGSSLLVVPTLLELKGSVREGARLLRLCSLPQSKLYTVSAVGGPQVVTCDCARGHSCDCQSRGGPRGKPH